MLNFAVGVPLCEYCCCAHPVERGCETRLTVGDLIGSRPIFSAERVLDEWAKRHGLVRRPAADAVVE